MPNETGISKAVRVWLSLGTLVFIAAAGCTDPGGDAARNSADTGGSDPATLPGPTVGEEREGGGASTVDPVSDDVEYLHQLGQARGHLAAFTALHRLGAHEMSMTHAKHPESELYAGLVPAFVVRGTAGFAEELDALTAAVETGANVDAAYADVRNAIGENEANADFATRLTAIAALARTAGNEFAIGVADDGTVVNAHEYQDAWGFLTAAREMLANTEAADAQEAQARALADEQLEIALAEFDTLTANRVDGAASAIHGAAERIEIEADMLR